MRKHYYIAVIKPDHRVRFVTGINNEKKTAEWKDDGTPEAFSKKIAEELSEALFLNGHHAVVVSSVPAICFQVAG